MGILYLWRYLENCTKITENGHIVYQNVDLETILSGGMIVTDISNQVTKFHPYISFQSLTKAEGNLYTIDNQDTYIPKQRPQFVELDLRA